MVMTDKVDSIIGIRDNEMPKCNKQVKDNVQLLKNILKFTVTTHAKRYVIERKQKVWMAFKREVVRGRQKMRKVARMTYILRKFHLFFYFKTYRLKCHHEM